MGRQHIQRPSKTLWRRSFPSSKISDHGTLLVFQYHNSTFLLRWNYTYYVSLHIICVLSLSPCLALLTPRAARSWDQGRGDRTYNALEFSKKDIRASCKGSAQRKPPEEGKASVGLRGDFPFSVAAPSLLSQVWISSILFRARAMGREISVPAGVNTVPSRPHAAFLADLRVPGLPIGFPVLCCPSVRPASNLLCAPQDTSLICFRANQDCG